MIAKINQVRENHGLRPLKTASKLMRSSRGYARHLIRVDAFGHGSSAERAGFRRSGEILALTRGWRRKPWPAIGMWLGSSGHRALMLDPSFRYVGASPATGRYGRALTTIWVVHFGAH